MHLSPLASTFAEHGWAVASSVISPPMLDTLVAALAPLADANPARGGVRGVLGVPAVRSLACSAPVRAVAESVLGPGCVAVRGIFFDKTPGANWKVTWHQDLTIAVRERREVSGFGPWTVKDGVVHVQPPEMVLRQMAAVRVHLDMCGAENGPVRVLPGSHMGGRLRAEEIDVWKARVTPVECVVDLGGILAFAPLLLHASSPARSPGHRRVVHLEFAAAAVRELPGGVVWADTVE